MSGEQYGLVRFGDVSPETPTEAGDSTAVATAMTTKQLFCVSVAAGVTVWGLTRILSSLFGEGK